MIKTKDHTFPNLRNIYKEKGNNVSKKKEAIHSNLCFLNNVALINFDQSFFVNELTVVNIPTDSVEHSSARET